MTYIDLFSGNSSGSGSGGSGGSTPVALDITNKQADFTVTAADDGKIFDNLGASGNITVTLPQAPVRGFTVNFLNAATMAASNFFLDFGSNVIRMPHLGQTSHLTCAYSGRDSACCLQVAYLGGGTWLWVGGYPFDWSSY